jgi:hypothetical protein
MVGVSRATQGEQIPWFSSSLVEDFSFATAGRATPDPAATLVEPEKNLPTARPDPDAAVRLAYQSAESAGTKKAWEDFIQKYPSGRYAELARQKLATLAPASNPATPVDDPAIKELDQKIALNRNDAAAYYKRGQLYEPPRVRRRPFDLSHAAMAGCSSMA